METNKKIADVEAFWESNPLFVGESTFEPGSREFFDEHRNMIVRDCMAGALEERMFPAPEKRRKVLDLGCGIGFWTIELWQQGCKNLVAADLTSRALELTAARCGIYGAKVETIKQNAEKLTFPDSSFSHVNCQGVIHHTPSPESCLKEIARVLEPGGTASISVYYKNALIQSWPLLNRMGKTLTRLGGHLKGRGRESIFSVSDKDEIVRMFDGSENPIGRAYSKTEYVRMLEPYFHVKGTYLHFFPARALPFGLPRSVHRLLDRHMGFMIYTSLEKR